jgi:hypothetical protein
MVLAFLVLVAVITNMSGFHTLLGQIDGAAQEAISEVWTGIKIIVGTALVLGVTVAIVRINHMRHVHMIGPTKHGPLQAVMYKGELVQLVSPATTMDPTGQLEYFRKLMQMAGQAALTTKRLDTYIDEDEDMVKLPAPSGVSIVQPRLSEAIGKLTRNALQVYWGRREDGADCILTLQDSMHTQKSGRTGLGKSYLTTSELYCLHTMNDPEVIQFAYIDLEGETTEPYWEAPHVWQYPVKTELRPAIARELDELEPMFTALNQELAFRDKHKDQAFPYLLVVIEEAEELIDNLEELPKAEQKTIMRLWKRLARRGRKRHIILDINVQNTYTDPIMRTAQRQFQLKITAAQQPSTARSGGFQDLELLKRLETLKTKGLFIVNHESGEYIIFAPFIDVDAPDFEGVTVEADRQYGKSGQSWLARDTDGYREVSQHAQTRENAYQFSRNSETSEVTRRNTDTLVNAPVERLPKTSQPTSETSRYQFTPEERPIVVNLYKKFGKIDEVLAAFGRGARWQASASAILREEGLL